MAVDVSASQGGTDFKPAPAGTHYSRCIRVIDLGTKANPFYNKDPKKPGKPTVNKVRLEFELCYEPMEDGRPFVVGKDYNATLGSSDYPSNLRKDLEAWRGREFTEEELQKFSLRSLPGLPCTVTITQSKDEKDPKKVYANIQSIGRVPKGPDGKVPEVKAAENKTFFLSLNGIEFSKENFDLLTDYRRKQIAESDEFRALFPGGLWNKPQSGDPGPDAPMGAPGHHQEAGFPDDDIPF